MKLFYFVCAINSRLLTQLDSTRLHTRADKNAANFAITNFLLINGALDKEDFFPSCDRQMRLND